jgi:hypothetical protein
MYARLGMREQATLATVLLSCLPPSYHQN